MQQLSALKKKLKSKETSSKTSGQDILDNKQDFAE